MLAASAAAGEAGSTAMLFDRFDQLTETRLMEIEAEAMAGMAEADLWMVAPPAANDPSQERKP